MPPRKHALLDLTGTEKVKSAYLESLCSLCPTFIDRGDWQVDFGTYRMHQRCADRWLDSHGRNRTTGGLNDHVRI